MLTARDAAGGGGLTPANETAVGQASSLSAPDSQDARPTADPACGSPMTGAGSLTGLVSRTVNQKVEPAPGLLLTPMLPPISSTSLRQMASPKPVPPYLRVVDASAWVKDWNRFSCACSAMPMPVSRTAQRNSTSSLV